MSIRKNNFFQSNKSNYWLVLCLTLFNATIIYGKVQDTTGQEFYILAEKNHNDFNKYLQYGLKAMPLLKKEKRYQKYLKTVRGMMFVNYYISKLDTALFYAEKLALEIPQLPIPPSEKFDLLNRLGTFYYNDGRYKKSVLFYEESYKIWQENHLSNSEKLNLGDYYNNKGLLYNSQGDIFNAINYYQKAIEEYAQFPASYYLESGIVLHNIALFYQYTKKYDQALAHFNKAIKIHRNYPMDYLNKRFYARVLLQKGRLLIEQKQFSKAKQLFQQVLDLPNLRQDFYGIANRHLGNAYVQAGQYSQGKTLLDQSFQQHRAFFPKKHLQTAQVYKKLATYFRKTKKYEDALITTQRAIHALIPTFQDSLNFQTNPSLTQQALSELELTKLLRLKAQLLVANNNHTAALSTYKLLIERILIIKSGYQSIESKFHLSNNTSVILAEAINLCFNLYKENPNKAYLSAAFYFFEVNQATILLSKNQAAKSALTTELPDSIVLNKEQLLAQIDFYKKQSLEKSLFKADSLFIVKKLFLTTNELHQLNNYIAQTFPNYHKTTNTLEINTLKNLQQNFLQPQQLFLTYFYGDSLLYTLAISKNKCSFKSTLIKEIEPKLHAFNLQFTPQISGMTPYIDKQIPYQLFQEFIEKSLVPFSKIKELIIVRDRLLSQIPFGALWTSKRTNAQELPTYLLQDFAISYAPNASFLIQYNKWNKSKDLVNFIGFAPQFQGKEQFLAERSCEINDLRRLAFNEKEVKQIAQSVQGNFFTKTDATKANFIKSTNKARILHLATHACVDDINNEQSRIFFTDDYLFLHELYNLKTKSEMVVLSACETGIGSFKRGEGVLSLAHAFAYAGVPSITMSLWSVNDESTAKLMQYYYQHLKAGKAKHQALRQAKLEYLANCESVEKLHPYYWAGFVHLGDYEPIFAPANTLFKTSMLFTILAFFISFFYYFQKKIKKN